MPKSSGQELSAVVQPAEETDSEIKSRPSVPWTLVVAALLLAAVVLLWCYNASFLSILSGGLALAVLLVHFSLPQAAPGGDKRSVQVNPIEHSTNSENVYTPPPQEPSVGLIGGAPNPDPASTRTPC